MEKTKHEHVCVKCGKVIKFWNINYYDEKKKYSICNQCANLKEKTKEL
jgi:hypothetical protein